MFAQFHMNKNLTLMFCRKNSAKIGLVTFVIEELI